MLCCVSIILIPRLNNIKTFFQLSMLHIKLLIICIILYCLYCIVVVVTSLKIGDLITLNLTTFVVCVNKGDIMLFLLSTSFPVSQKEIKKFGT